MSTRTAPHDGTPASARGGAPATVAGVAPDGERDRGSTSLTVVLLAPITTALMFVGFQAALWNHARTDARVVARDVAALVARAGMPLAQASAAAREALAGSDLRETQVQVTTDGTSVTVSIRGDAPGILRGTSHTVSVRVQLPLEGWVPL